MLLVFSFVGGISATTEEWIGLIDEGMIKQQNADAQHRSGIMHLLLFEGIGLLIGAKGKNNTQSRQDLERKDIQILLQKSQTEKSSNYEC